MREEDALLRAAWVAPDDELPRLIYADWLEEHGRPEQAEFIRLQVRLAGLDVQDGEHRHLAWRAHRAAGRHSLAWKDRAPDWARSHLSFERGLPTRLNVIGHADINWVGVAALAAARGVRSLATSAAAAAVARPSILGRLHELDWVARSRDELLRLLGEPALVNLGRLSLAWGEPIADGCAAVAASPHLAGLRHLTLSGPTVTDAGSLADSVSLRPLSLSLQQVTLSADGAARLLASPAVGWLESLRIQSRREVPRAAKAVAASPHLGGLRRLHLAGLGVTDGGAIDLGRCRRLENLEVLDLGLNRLTAAGVDALAAGHFPALRRLRLSGSRLGPGGTVELWRSSPAAGLTELALNSTELGNRDLIELGRSDAARLRCLLLSGNPQLDEAGLRALGESPAAAGLAVLRLSRCGLRNGPVEALAGSPHLRNLTELDLSHNEVRIRGVRALAESPVLAGVSDLYLDGNPVGDAAADALIASPHLGQARRLSLQNCRLRYASVRRLRDHFGDAVVAD